MSKLSTKLIYFILINYQIIVVYTQDNLNSSQTYTSLIILLFFLFTIFGILTAFLIKHKPRRRGVSLSRGGKDLENSKEIAFLESENQNDYFEFLESNKPVINFEPKNVALNSEINKNSDITVKEKLMRDYLNQSSDDLEFRSPDSLSELNKQFRQSLGLDEDDTSLQTQSTGNLEFKEIPKNLIIVNGELINSKNNNLQTEETKKNVKHDSVTYNLSVDEKKSDKDIKLDKLIKKDNDTQTEPFELKEDNLDKINKLENKKQNIDNLLKEIVDKKNNLLNQYDKNQLNRNEKLMSESNEISNETCTKNKTDIENRLKKMSAKEEIPESSTFPAVSDNESIKSAKSYHSYGFYLEEDDYQLGTQLSKFPIEDKNTQNSIQRWNSKLEKPSDYDEMMKNLNQFKLNDTPTENNSKREANILPDNKTKQNEEIKELKKLDEKSEISSKSTESSVKYEYKVIVCPPLDPNNPNAKYLENNKTFSSPTEPLELINESENSFSNPQLDELNQRVKNVLESKSKEINSLKPINKLDESGSLKTLNSIDTSLSSKNSPETLPFSSNLTSTPKLKSSSNLKQNNLQTTKNKSVLGVLERRLKN